MLKKTPRFYFENQNRHISELRRKKVAFIRKHEMMEQTLQFKQNHSSRDLTEKSNSQIWINMEKEAIHGKTFVFPDSVAFSKR